MVRSGLDLPDRLLALAAASHNGEQVHLDGEMIDLVRKDDSRLPVAVRILLPVQEVIRRADLQRIIGHRRAAVRRRAQPDDLRSQRHRAAVAITGEVMEAGLDHGADTATQAVAPQHEYATKAVFGVRP